MKRSTYFLLGWIFLGIGILGAFLPVLPSTCFFIFAAYFFGHSSEKLEKRILEHPVFGPSVLGWRENKSIPMTGKIAAVIGMSFSGILMGVSGAPIWVLLGTWMILIASALYVVTRPTLKPSRSETSLRST